MAFVLLLGLAMAMLLSQFSEANAKEPVLDYEVKATFLFNFAKFVSWPSHAFPDSTSPIQIGIYGEDPFDKILDKIMQKQSISGRKFAVKRSQNLKDLKDCHIIFISRSKEKHLPQILKDLQGTSILTVGESDRFAQRGGIINFIEKENKIRFEINVEAAKAAGLQISSKLLQLAIVINSPNGRKN